MELSARPNDQTWERNWTFLCLHNSTERLSSKLVDNTFSTDAKDDTTHFKSSGNSSSFFASYLFKVVCPLLRFLKCFFIPLLHCIAPCHSQNLHKNVSIFQYLIHFSSKSVTRAKRTCHARRQLLDPKLPPVVKSSSKSCAQISKDLLLLVIQVHAAL